MGTQYLIPASDDTILNHGPFCAFGFGPRFCGASLRLRRLSSPATNLGEPSGRPVRSPAPIASWSFSFNPQNSGDTILNLEAFGSGCRGASHDAPSLPPLPSLNARWLQILSRKKINSIHLPPFLCEGQVRKLRQRAVARLHPLPRPLSCALVKGGLWYN
jgi:hypothetical protein